MKRGMSSAIVFTLLMVLFPLNFVLAENVAQTITLEPGWNSVFLEVEPASTDPTAVFSSVTFNPGTAIDDLLSVWRWNPRTSTVEFIQDPNTLLPEQPGWMVYYPGNTMLTNLHAVNGETAYLVHLGGSATVTWTVEGQPVIPRIDWKPNAFNFVGFHFIAGNEPFFENFFSSSPAHAGQDIYILNDLGAWEKVSSPNDTFMKAGEGFWIYCMGSSVFTGPLAVQPRQSAGLPYGKTLSEQDLTIFNHSATDMNVNLSFSNLTGNLYYWTFNPAQARALWEPFPSPLALAVPAGQSQTVRVGLKRAGLTADMDYEANLSVSEAATSGMEVLVPLSATGVSYAGLWVGDATINKVSEPANVSDPDTPVKTGSAFSFRLIIHVGPSGSAVILSHVIQMWQEGTWKPDPNDPGKLIVDQPGYFVLLADDARIPDYSGSALLDGRPVGRRISAPVFPRIDANERAMGTMNPVAGNSLATTITLEADDPTNPFRHLYHPDHNQPSQSRQVIRDISLTFSDTDADGNPISGIFEMTQGSSQVGGIYTETVYQIHKDPLKLQGTFLLHKVSEVDTLIE